MDGGNKQGKTSHAVMSSSLAKALIEAGVQHYDLGGFVGDALHSVAPPGSVANDVFHITGGSPLTGVVGDYINRGLLGGALNNPFGSMLGGGGPFGGNMPGQNSFQPRDPGGEEAHIQRARNMQGQVYGNQVGLANALLAQSQGRGPNPALAQLNQATGQNAAMQGALMASQRGASANPGLIARQAAMQGANVQQQAVGQAATLQAQQQLAAQGALQQQYNNMGNLALNSQGLEQGMLANINNTNANVAAGNAKNQAGIFGGLLQAGSGLLAMGLKGGGVNGATTAANTTPVDASGGYLTGPTAMESQGGAISGKALVSGDSPKNDVVPAMLSPGEAVIPRSIMQSPDMERKALAFLQHLKGRKSSGYGSVLEARKARG